MGRKERVVVHTVLSRDQIREADDTQFEFVKMPEWSGGDPEAGLWVRGLTGTARDKFDMSMIRNRGRKVEVNVENLRARLLILTVVNVEEDADGQPLSDTAKPYFEEKDASWLGKKSGAAIQRVYAVAQRLSGLGAEDVEELTAELGEGQSDGSGSDWHSPSDTEASPMLSEPSAVESSPNGEPTTV